MDHLEFPIEQLHGNTINYSTLRALHVCNADFEPGLSIDHNNMTLEQNVFGKCPVCIIYLHLIALSCIVFFVFFLLIVTFVIHVADSLIMQHTICS
jgi:hypothetical protein